MKKIMMMLAAAMLLTATTANAQFRKKDNNRVPDRFHMGIRGGVTASTLTGDNTDDIKGLWFPTAGFGLDFQVAPIPIFLGVGLYYQNQGYSYDRVYTTGSSRYGYTTYTETKDVDAHCVQLPLTASYHINVAPNLFINPFLGPWFSYNCEDLDNDNDWNDDRFDYGVRFGCGMNFGRLTLDLGYDIGLKNWYEGNKDYTINTGILFMTVGFNWAGSR